MSEVVIQLLFNTIFSSHTLFRWHFLLGFYCVASDLIKTKVYLTCFNTHIISYISTNYGAMRLNLVLSCVCDSACMGVHVCLSAYMHVCV